MFLQNWKFCSVTLFQVVRIEKVLSQAGVIFPDIHFEYLQPYVIFKLDVLCNNSVSSCQIGKIHSQTGVIFSDDHFEYQEPYVIFKLNIWSHISVYLNSICSIFT